MSNRKQSFCINPTCRKQLINPTARFCEKCITSLLQNPEQQQTGRGPSCFKNTLGQSSPSLPRAKPSPSPSNFPSTGSPTTASAGKLQIQSDDEHSSIDTPRRHGQKQNPSDKLGKSGKLTQPERTPNQQLNCDSRDVSCKF